MDPLGGHLRGGNRPSGTAVCHCRACGARCDVAQWIAKRHTITGLQLPSPDTPKATRKMRGTAPEHSRHGDTTIKRDVGTHATPSVAEAQHTPRETAHRHAQ